MTSAPKRERSNREHAVAINSMPQHAVAKGSGQTLERRAQFTTRLSCVVTTLSFGRAVSSPIASVDLRSARKKATRKVRVAMH